MKYDFESALSRIKMGSVKWKMMKEACPDVPPDVVPFSVADMEFKNPPEIIEGLKEHLDNMILGYTAPTDAYYDAVCGWMEKRNGWNVQKEWIVCYPGVVGAFYTAVYAVG